MSGNFSEELSHILHFSMRKKGVLTGHTQAMVGLAENLE